MSAPRGWSLDPETWDRLHEVCGGRPWRRTYLGSDYKSQVPMLSGVYVICVDTKHLDLAGKVFDVLYNAIYVGQAQNLRRRYNNHLRGYGDVTRAIATFGRVHFWYALASSDELNTVEQSVMDALGPSANRSNAVRASIGDPINLSPRSTP